MLVLQFNVESSELSDLIEEHVIIIGKTTATT